MRKTTIAAYLSACLSTTTLAAPSTPIVNDRALREECGTSSQASLRDCLAQQAKERRRALQQAEESAADALKQWDESDRYADQARARLAASNQAFAQYRDAHCGFMASLVGGGAGNAHEIRRLACTAELDGNRAAQLRDAVIDLPAK